MVPSSGFSLTDAADRYSMRQLEGVISCVAKPGGMHCVFNYTCLLFTYSFVFNIKFGGSIRRPM